MKLSGLLRGDCADGFRLAGIDTVSPDGFSKTELEDSFYKLCENTEICAVFISSDIAKIIGEAIENHRKTAVFPMILTVQENYNEVFNENFLIDYIFNSTGMKV